MICQEHAETLFRIKQYHSNGIMCIKIGNSSHFHCCIKYGKFRDAHVFITDAFSRNDVFFHTMGIAIEAFFAALKLRRSLISYEKLVDESYSKQFTLQNNYKYSKILQCFPLNSILQIVPVSKAPKAIAFKTFDL